MRDPELWHRVLRFLPTLGLPLVLALLVGPETWVIYAVMSAITGFLGDSGGPRWQRLGLVAIGPLALLAGAALGTVTGGGSVIFFMIVFALGLFYGVVEGGEDHLLLFARFFGYGLVLGHAVVPLVPMDVLAALVVTVYAWGVSLICDHVRVLARAPARTATGAAIGPALMGAFAGAAARWPFVLCAGIAVAAGNIAGFWLGIGHPYWATLTILVVLRGDPSLGANLVSDRVLATVLAVGLVGLMMTLGPSRDVLLLCLAAAAFARLPLASAGNMPGTAAATCFALLLAELLAPDAEVGMQALRDRMLAIMVGCCFAMAGTGLAGMLSRWRAGAAAAGG